MFANVCWNLANVYAHFSFRQIPNGHIDTFAKSADKNEKSLAVIVYQEMTLAGVYDCYSWFVPLFNLQILSASFIVITV